MLANKGYYLVLFTLCQLFAIAPASYVVDVTEENISELVKSYDLVLLNFYVNSCKYSKQLEPVFNHVAQLVRIRYPESGRIVLGRVDCDIEKELANRYFIRKYPTVAVVQHGIVRWHEYRGRRSAEGLMEYLETHINDPVKEIKSENELDKLLVHPNPSKLMVIGYFTNDLDQEYKVFRDAVRYLGPYGQFYVALDDVNPDGRNKIAVKGKNQYYLEFGGNKTNVEEVLNWIFYQCLPLVQEITFENAEILTESHLPLLILFHRKDDHESVRIYREAIESQPEGDSNYHKAAKFVTAQAEMFTHAIYHMGKTEADLPLIAFDTFQHMYVFPKFEDIRVPGRLQQFIEDLYMGKLHFDYHLKEEEAASEANKMVVTSIPESKFKHLKVSKHRYTFVKEEL